jgi:formate dehydrogenase iron-sulfur subunit
VTARVYVPRDAAALGLGADAVASLLRQSGDVEVVRTGSRGLFWLEPMVEVATPQGRTAYGPVTVADISGLLQAGMLTGGAHPLRLGRPEELPFLARQTRLTFARCGIVDPLSLDDYRAHGGLKGLAQARDIGPAATIELVTQSGLRGRGGAGFPTGIKWKTAADAPGARKFIVCNADEGDSGTYADRMLMEGDPFVLIEGMAIAGFAVGASKGYVYTRSEYPHAIATFDAALDIARREGLLGAGFDIEQRVGAGAYVCGEETSLLDSLEGKRGQVRPKPPLPAHRGLFGAPTVINNVVTLASVPIILSQGAEYYREIGKGRSRGTMPIQLAGNIRHAGLFECGFGVTLGELVNDIGGGTRSAWRLFPARAVRYPVRLRGIRREGRIDRPRRRRGVRRYRGHGKAGALRHGILRRGILRQVHAVPRRLGARHGGDRPHRRRRQARGQPRSVARPLPYDEVRLALRAGRLHPLPSHQRAGTLAGRLRHHAPRSRRMINPCHCEERSDEAISVGFVCAIDHGKQ